VKVVISVGGRFHAVALAEQLDHRGYLAKIITTKSWYVRSKFAAGKWTAIPSPEALGMLVRKIPSLRRAGYYSYVKDNLFDALARKYIPPCDVLHAWGNYALYCIPTARHLGAKVVIERGSTHPHYQDDILREEFERHGVRSERAHPQIIAKGLEEIALADKVIIPSEFVRRTFLANGVEDAKLSVIPYGADLSLFRKEQKRDDVFRALFVGNISVQKGIHYLLEAWKKLALPNAELQLVGRIDDDARPLLDRYAGLFTHTGHVKHEDLSAVYGNASVFILPSLQEGSAMVTYEAMACGLPSIVSENTGSILRNGVDGCVIPIRSADAIAEKLTWMREHPDEVAAMGESAMAYVQGFTWDRYADGVIEVYRDLLAPGGGA
jgi:glycosyltransferase involved in cell wall biosynthesis